MTGTDMVVEVIVAVLLLETSDDDDIDIELVVVIVLLVMMDDEDIDTELVEAALLLETSDDDINIGMVAVNDGWIITGIDELETDNIELRADDIKGVADVDGRTELSK